MLAWECHTVFPFRKRLNYFSVLCRDEGQLVMRL
jgi:hypothetical protein